MPNSVPKLIIRKTRWWNSKWFDVLQLFVFMVGLVWVTFNGANQMGYNWQWYRIPQYFYEIIDGDFNFFIYGHSSWGRYFNYSYVSYEWFPNGTD